MQELESEKSYGWFERFLFYTLPVLFTLLLTGVLLTVFGYDVMDEALRVGNKIPLLSNALPDPLPRESDLRDAAGHAGDNEAAGAQEVVPEAEVQALEDENAEKQSQIEQLLSDGEKKDEQIAALTQQVQQLQAQLENMTVTDAEYTANIKELADVYANMSPSKAAPVLESLTLTERVLVLGQMKQDEQVAILEKMDPVLAAETSIRMKDLLPAKDAQIAALQDRLKQYDEAQASAGTGLTKGEVSQTFAQMEPDKAAAVLLEMSGSNLENVVNILRLMEPAARASILDALTELSEEQTAKITERLG